MLKDNLKDAFARSGMIVKVIADKSEVNKRTIDKWVAAAPAEPKIGDLYKVCRALGITVEWAVDGEEGLNYVRNLMANEGRLWEPPENLLEIVNILKELDDNSFGVVKKMITALTKEDQIDKSGHPLYTKAPEEVYQPESIQNAIDISRYKTDRVNDIQFVDWDIVMLPFYGSVAAGHPIDISYFPGEGIPFPQERLTGEYKNYFCVQIQGTSMINAGINDGDYVVIHRTEEAIHGKIMLVRYGDESTLKRIKITTDKKGYKRYYLCWDDGSKKTQLVDSDEYEILGEFYLVLRDDITGR